MKLNKDAVHRTTYEALEAVDAQMFTGDPGETEDMFNLLKFYVDRWATKMKEVEQDPWFKEEEKLVKKRASSPLVPTPGALPARSGRSRRS